MFSPSTFAQVSHFQKRSGPFHRSLFLAPPPRPTLPPRPTTLRSRGSWNWLSPLLAIRGAVKTTFGKGLHLAECSSKADERSKAGRRPLGWVGGWVGGAEKGPGGIGGFVLRNFVFCDFLPMALFVERVVCFTCSSESKCVSQPVVCFP